MILILFITQENLRMSSACPGFPKGFLRISSACPGFPKGFLRVSSACPVPEPGLSENICKSKNEYVN